MQEIQGITKSFTMQDAAGATGNGEAMDVAGMVVCGMQISGTFSGTVTFEGSIDGVNYEGMLAAKLSDGSTALTETTEENRIVFLHGVYKYVRARISVWASGSITVVARASAISSGIVLT